MSFVCLSPVHWGARHHGNDSTCASLLSLHGEMFHSNPSFSVTQLLPFDSYRGANALGWHLFNIHPCPYTADTLHSWKAHVSPADPTEVSRSSGCTDETAMHRADNFPPVLLHSTTENFGGASSEKCPIS